MPVTFALVGDDRLVTAIDHKPKTTMRLQRLANIDARPEVTVLVDHYEDDWEQLWWVRLRGDAHAVAAGDEWDEAVAALVARYAQYEERPPDGPVIVVEITSWLGWAWTPTVTGPADLP